MSSDWEELEQRLAVVEALLDVGGEDGTKPPRTTVLQLLARVEELEAAEGPQEPQLDPTDVVVTREQLKVLVSGVAAVEQLTAFWIQSRQLDQEFVVQVNSRLAPMKRVLVELIES